jgi:hypothetical protein
MMTFVAKRKIAPGVRQLVPGPFGPVGRFSANPWRSWSRRVARTATSSGCGPGPM